MPHAPESHNRRTPAESRTVIQRAIVILCLSLAAACSDTELVGLHVRLETGGAGSFTARSVVIPNEASGAEGRTQGVQWKERAALLSSQGSFADIGQLQFGGIRFLGGTRRDEMPRLRVFVPRGPDAAWVAALVPDAEARRRAAKVYDPTGKTREIAGAIRIEVQFPETVISSGAEPRGRGVETSHERNRAWLVIPVTSALEKGDELVWDVSWK
jgi:hypothetical protein